MVCYEQRLADLRAAGDHKCWRVSTPQVRFRRISTRGNPPETESVSLAFVKPAPRTTPACRRRPW